MTDLDLGPTRAPTGTGRRRVWQAAALDVAAVVLFVVLGRSSHDAGNTLAGLATTVWPFLVGLGVGWIVARSWRAPRSIVPAAVGSWLGAVVVGMTLRALTGAGTAVSFVIVASAFLAAALFGWRIVAAASRRG